MPFDKLRANGKDPFKLNDSDSKPRSRQSAMSWPPPPTGRIGSTDKQQVTMKGGHVSLFAGGNAIGRLRPKPIDRLGDRST